MSLLKRLFGDQLPELVLFDLDGTLIDSAPDLADAVDRMLTSCHLPSAGEARVREWVGNGAQMLVRRALAWACGATDATAVPSELFTPAHLAFLGAYRENFRRRTRLYEGVMDCVTALHEKAIPLAVVTNKPLEFVEPLLQHFGMATYFSLSLGGDSLPAKKPNPLPLQYASEHFSAQPGNCLMVGDSRNDVEAARACGMPVVCVSYGYNHGESIAASAPDAVIDSLLGLL